MTGQFDLKETVDGPMNIYVSGETNGVPLVVIQEAFGVNHHIRSVCDRLANEGFYTVAPEHFHRLGAHIEIPYGDRKQILPYLEKLSNDEILKDISATISFLTETKSVKAEVSSIGFCMGGFSSVLAATELPLKKMVSFYGAGLVHSREGVGLAPILDQLKKIKAQCLFFFGAEDASIPQSDIEAMRERLQKYKIKHEIIIFEGADHGFFCDERKSFHPEARDKAWKKLLEFLKS
jgi:carboxymethylenebutenolidase